MSVASILPAVTRNFVSAADPPRDEYDCFRPENFEATALPFVTKGADRAIPIFQDRQDGVLHVHVDAAVHAVILQGANHFQTGAISNVREPRISVAAEI